MATSSLTGEHIIEHLPFCVIVLTSCYVLRFEASARPNGIMTGPNVTIATGHRKSPKTIQSLKRGEPNYGAILRREYDQITLRGRKLGSGNTR
jgi:hypothetical protein